MKSYSGLSPVRRPLCSPLLISAACAAVACSAPREPLPLRPEPIPYADTLPIAPPAENDPFETTEMIKTAVGREAVRFFDLRRWTGAPLEALNVTHMDDVVSSAWYERRNGHYSMSLEEIRRGPATTGGPDTSATLTVIAGKSEGISPGFTVRDARDDIYLFKFDPAGNLRLASGADVIASRLFYAAGYHVPEDYIVVFDSAHLVLDPDAEISTETGDRRMAPSDIREILVRTDALPDGRFLALASKFLEGRPAGPFLFDGVRSDDPNDHYPHQHRRELRGLYVVASWLNHVDMRFANTLDVYVEPGYLRHNLIDFAATLGSGTIHPHWPREGAEYNFDLWPTLGRLVTLGFYQVGWEGEPFEEIHPAIGWMPVEDFDPAGWKTNWPNAAFNSMTVRDAYWGAKLVGSFSDEQLRAVVGEAQLPPAAADTLVEILAFRRDRVLEHWYGEVTPIERPHVVANGAASFELAFTDLGIGSGLWRSGETTYRWEFRYPAFERTWSGHTVATEGAEQKLVITGTTGEAGIAPDTPSGRDRLATLRILADRPRTAGRWARVHLRWTASGYLVVGLEH